jgi:orotidine-5'-phosphate decarboxylase
LELPSDVKEARQGGVFIALDFADLSEALVLTNAIGPQHQLYKIGLELFTAYGPLSVSQLIAENKKIFLDLKLHDIPNTVAGACRSIAKLGAEFLTIHAEGGAEMIRAARITCDEEAGRYAKPPLKLLAVTRLTSLASTPEQVTQLAILAQESGAHGVIASPLEASAIKKNCGEDFLVVCPGIRRQDSTVDDQRRVSTPGAAADAGADYIVVGRPITRAKNPAVSLKEISDEFLAGKKHKGG